MSAIAAVYYLEKKASPRLIIEEMLRTLHHRGEDQVGTWGNKFIALGNCLRWTTEESIQEKLPRKSKISDNITACDARIDNRSELIKQLFSANHQCESGEITDSEIILASYEKWGEECLPKLIGDFVFVIWDSKQKKLFCGRDALGVKHFYYYYEPNKVFALASEIKALFCLQEVERRLNEEYLGDYLVQNFEDKESTPFLHIKRLPATHGLIINAHKMKIWRYWQPNPTEEIKLRNHKEYQEAFREKFTAAVKCRLRSAFPIGAMLSGGLDSSSIVCAASEHLSSEGKPRLHSFSAIFPTTSAIDFKIDERSYMQSVIKKTGCQAHYVNCDDDNPWKDMKKLMRYSDNPVGMPNMYIHWEIFKEAQKHGVKVLLDGFDGDSTVSHGYEDLFQMSQQGRILRLLKEIMLLNKNMPHPAHSYKNFKRLILTGLDNSLPLNFARLGSFTTQKSGVKTQKKTHTALRWKIINNDFRKKYDLDERYKRCKSKNFSEKSTNIERHWEILTSGHFANSLESVELASQAFSVEQRFPFFDRRLIEFCIALPPGERIYNGWTRAIFRYAMKDLLPEDVRWRDTKAILGIGLKLNMLKYSVPDLEDAVEINSNILENYLNLDLLKAVLRRFAENPLKCTDYDCLILVASVHLSNWLREYEFSDCKSIGFSHNRKTLL